MRIKNKFLFFKRIRLDKLVLIFIYNKKLPQKKKKLIFIKLKILLQG
jgi:hypothetical protein